MISGLSGGGKSKAASFLEDMGFYIVDNMPAGLMLKFAEFCASGSSRYNRVALVYDVRTADSFDEFLQVLATLRQRGYNCRLLFLEADVGTIIKRYKETRRLHPLQDQGGTLEEAVDREIEMMRPVREQADVIINSTTYSTARLRGELFNLFGGEKSGELTVSVESFGFKHGLPMEADLVFDVRFMPNPFYIDALRGKTGLDPEVRDYVFSFRETEEFLRRVRDLLQFVLPLYREEGKTVLVVAVGCTGGHHRSVAVTHALAEYIASLGYQVTENHRDMTRS
jgi:UPF0042 nucleotide-binding protein